MSVYFVYRTHYNEPSLLHIQKYDDASILDGFKRIWEPLDEDAAEERVEELLGVDVYGFDILFLNIEENNLQAPESIDDLRSLLEEHLYYEGEVIVSENCIQVLTDDDEIQLAYYFFDDSYLNKSSLAEFITRQDWELPQQSDEENIDLSNEEVLEIQPSGSGDGVIYLAFLAFYDSGGLEELSGASKISGVRLSNLRSFLLEITPPEDNDWPFELHLLRCIFSDIADLEKALKIASEYPILRAATDTEWGFDAMSVEESKKVLQDLWQDEFVSFDPGEVSDKLKIQVDDNFAQVSIPLEKWGDDLLFYRWIIFDDTWVSKNSKLAQCILRFASRWDVLTT